MWPMRAGAGGRGNVNAVGDTFRKTLSGKAMSCVAHGASGRCAAYEPPKTEIMHGFVIHLDGTKRKTHVLELSEHEATTSFGTFRRVDGKWCWICDERFELELPAGAHRKALASPQLMTPPTTHTKV